MMTEAILYSIKLLCLYLKKQMNQWTNIETFITFNSFGQKRSVVIKGIKFGYFLCVCKSFVNRGTTYNKRHEKIINYMYCL